MIDEGEIEDMQRERGRERLRRCETGGERRNRMQMHKYTVIIES